MGNFDHALQGTQKATTQQRLSPSLCSQLCDWLSSIVCCWLHVTASISYSISYRQLHFGGILLSREEWAMCITANVTLMKLLPL